MELKPCPFCSGSADVFRINTKYGRAVYVKCDSCGAQTRLVSVKENANGLPGWAYETPVDEAGDLWNKRE